MNDTVQNRDLPVWLNNLISAGDALFRLGESERNRCAVEQCGHCSRMRVALLDWGKAVARACESNTVAKRCSHRGCGYVTISEFDKFCGACGSKLKKVSKR